MIEYCGPHQILIKGGIQIHSNINVTCPRDIQYAMGMPDLRLETLFIGIWDGLSQEFHNVHAYLQLFYDVSSGFPYLPNKPDINTAKTSTGSQWCERG